MTDGNPYLDNIGVEIDDNLVNVPELSWVEQRRLQ